MANMTAKHGAAKYQCSCCDKGGRTRRSGRRGVKQKEARAWRKDQKEQAR